MLRFPNDFLFRLSVEEWGNMRSQFVTTSQNKRNTLKTPFAFTEQGVAMLSSIINSDKAIDVNIAIMRAFFFLRQYALNHKDLTDKLKEMEHKYDRKFKDVFEAINYLFDKDKVEIEQKDRPRIGFK